VVGHGGGGGSGTCLIFDFSCIIVVFVVSVVIYNLRIPVNFRELKLLVLCCNRFCNGTTNTVYPVTWAKCYGTPLQSVTPGCPVQFFLKKQ